MGARREEWRKRIERWRDSELTAEEFAAEMGLNVGTLRHWKYTLDREARLSCRPMQRAQRREMRTPEPKEPALPLVEIQAAPSSGEGRFEIELGCGRRLRVPATFEANALRRLLMVLEERA